MSTTLHKEEQEQTEQPSSPSASREKETEDTEMEEEVVNSTDKKQKTEGKDEGKEIEKDQQEEKKQEKEKTPAKPKKMKTSSQTTTSASTSATKRKFDALHTRNAVVEPSILEHEKNKKARASALMKTPGTKRNGSAKKAPTKTREFSFARPTESSASRTAAVARDHAHANAMPTSTPVQKPLHPKRTPAKAQRASMPAPKTPATTAKTSRPHFNYTPYTGPLPPLTVESSFAPKGSLNLDRGARTASPIKTSMATSARKPRPALAQKTQHESTAGKENNGVYTEEDAATNAASSSKTSRIPLKTSKSGAAVTTEENRSASKEKIKDLHSISQQAARSSPCVSSATSVNPTA